MVWRNSVAVLLLRVDDSNARLSHDAGRAVGRLPMQWSVKCGELDKGCRAGWAWDQGVDCSHLTDCHLMEPLNPFVAPPNSLHASTCSPARPSRGIFFNLTWTGDIKIHVDRLFLQPHMDWRY
eukprot:202508-Chlamydomonas_euryale.AAC.5